jgi:aspartyl-tRNA(Asn)/glutamyl-tRNA(Gln) amidotransferase subunit B
MSNIYDKYQVIIGLEVHAQLLTKTKAFSSDINEYGGTPNTHVNPVSLGHPGTLPKLNRKSVEYAIKLGLAFNTAFTEVNRFARKNYFYADLPKGYQITQFDTPICTGGFVEIKLEDGSPKQIKLTRIHIEEDSGKSIHDLDPFNTLVDLNRAGVPLLEIVSEPDIRSGYEAYQYLTEVRKMVRYLDICDGNMEEGSLRCDANISVMLKGADEYGIKVEVKNMNSIRNVQRAIDYEIKRQIDTIESGGEIFLETRSFDAAKGTTFSMRGKELANDYRYFPEPDLPPVLVTEKLIKDILDDMPALPAELHEKFTTEYGLNEYDASVLTDSKPIALYFDDLTNFTQNYKAAANWVMVEIKAYLNENGLDIEDFALSPEKVADIIALIDTGKVSHSAASQKIFPSLIQSPTKKAAQIAEELNLIIESNEDSLLEFAKQAMAKYPEKVTEYKNGKHGLLGLFMGEIMKLSQGKADPKKVNEILKQQLEN